MSGQRWERVAKNSIACRRRRLYQSLPLPPGEGRGEGELRITNAPAPFLLPRGEGFYKAFSDQCAAHLYFTFTGGMSSFR